MHNPLASLISDSSLWSAARTAVETAGAAAGAISTGVAWWRAFRSKRVLTYSMPEFRHFKKCTRELPEGLIGNFAPKDPHILRFTLASHGRKDISSDTFDRNRPLRFNFQVPVLRCFGVTTIPGSFPAPDTGIDGTELLVGPSLIHRNQTITFYLLVEGEPRLAEPVNTLCDVRLKRRRLADRCEQPPVTGVVIGDVVFLGRVAL